MDDNARLLLEDLALYGVCYQDAEGWRIPPWEVRYVERDKAYPIDRDDLSDKL
jgi:hypothetical protein